MLTEPFTIPAYDNARVADILAVAHEMCDNRTDAHRHCAFSVESDMTPDSDDFVWDNDCDEMIAYIEAAK